jgi:hypothetical protein
LHWRWTDALRSFDRALETAPSDLHSVGSGGWLNALVGREVDARRINEEIQAIGKRRPIGAGSYAMAAAAVGDYDEVLRWLGIAAEKVD